MKASIQSSTLNYLPNFRRRVLFGIHRQHRFTTLAGGVAHRGRGDGPPDAQVVNRLYTFQVKADNLHFLAMMDRALAEALRWDEPEFDEIILSAIASSRRRAEEGE